MCGLTYVLSEVASVQTRSRRTANVGLGLIHIMDWWTL